MQNTKNSKEVLGTGIATDGLQKINAINKEFVDWIDYDSIKEDVDYLLLGWISGDAMEYQSNCRVEIFSFFTNLLNQTKKIYAVDESKTIECYDWILSLKPSKVKYYFKSTLTAFIESEFANDQTIRTRINYNITEMGEYFEKVYKITKKHELQTT